MNEQNQAKILVVGSSNTDMVVRTKRLPCAGETVLGGTFLMNQGGKGANQAVAVARLGGHASFICCVGDDMFGHQSIELFEKEGIDTSGIVVDERHPSGVALITVDEKGENCIVVASGANAHLTPKNWLPFTDKLIEEYDYVLMQLEIPLETVEHVADIALRSGKKVILNPAPGRRLSSELLKKIYLITPNETEAEILSGIAVTDYASAVRAAEAIAGAGAANVIITRGSRGALVYSDGKAEDIPANKVTAVDTTAAGDVFNGALTVGLSRGWRLTEAARFACKAASISVTRQGAIASIPDMDELGEFYIL